MTIDDHHPYSPATPGDSRSPCPALNALANHGFLPHDGRNISPSQLVAAIRQVYGLSWPFATLLAYGGTAKCGHADGLSLKLDLHDLAKHNVIEHNGSLVHDDAATGQTFAPTTVDPNLVHQLLDASDSSHLSLRDLCRTQVRRQAASGPLDSMQAYVSKGELDLIYQVFGVTHGSESGSGSPAEGGDLVVPKAFLEEWLGHERLPEGWDGPLREVGLVALVEHVKQISNLETEIKSTGKSGL
ncbi:Cloroperoxidase [Ganoderma leucocontextum]|nr:Cloroperoxidase [Ganoderma leucocontextum]